MLGQLNRGLKPNSLHFTRTFFSTSRYEKIVQSRENDLSKLAETIEKKRFEDNLFNGKLTKSHFKTSVPNSLNEEKTELILKSALATFLVHVESRISSSIGEGFYTIGPCGEELTAVAGELLDTTDPIALHYRHVATQIARQLKAGRSMEDILLDRARGHTCSVNDPVTGGRHCALGSPISSNDYYVTSTLASQTPPAVGRGMAVAMGAKVAGQAGLYGPPKEFSWSKDAISFVSLGDGSVNNAMFLGALNLAEYVRHKKFKCPTLFTISNNDLCISLKNDRYLIDSFIKKQAKLMPVYTCNGNDIFSMYETTKTAIDESRKTGRPGLLIWDHLSRRFGHAATDRQAAYLTPAEIMRLQQHDPLSFACGDALDSGLISEKRLQEIYTEIDSLVRKSFAQAADEPKISSSKSLIETNSPPAYIIPSPSLSVPAPEKPRRDIQRKLMQQVFNEALDADPRITYIGEDVRHGGYYAVTESLAKMYGQRVLDFPPCETSLLGAGLGMAQAGLIPIVEMPYAKYLDCAADMLAECAILSWCTNGQQHAGLVVRLQGFDKGVFGGNFHTHNSLSSVMMPGLDVVCFSNGRDYVRGMRHAMLQAGKGRLVMSVDPTDLLNRRHLDADARDNKWMAEFTPLPEDLKSGGLIDAKTGRVHEHAADYLLDFDTVMAYDLKSISTTEAGVPNPSYIRETTKGAANIPANVRTVIVTYGNGVPTSLNALKTMNDDSVIVLDVPYLSTSSIPSGLRALLEENKEIKNILFAEVCKEGVNPLSGRAVQLKNEKLLKGKEWAVAAASPTYNPLGSIITFLNENQIVAAVQELHKV